MGWGGQYIATRTESGGLPCAAARTTRGVGGVPGATVEEANFQEYSKIFFIKP